MTRWTMVADLERCVGCQTCTAACRHANATSPAVQWRKVLDIEAGTFPDVSRTFVPVGCQHCADPPCMYVCPTTATRQRPDGIVTIDYDLCIGCAYCEVACPYQARFLVHEPHFAYGRPCRTRSNAPMQHGSASHRSARSALTESISASKTILPLGSTQARPRPASTRASRTHCILVTSTIQAAMCRSCCASRKASACMPSSEPIRASITFTAKQTTLRRRGAMSLQALLQPLAKCVRAVSSPHGKNIGTGKPPAISFAAAWEADCSCSVQLSASIMEKLLCLAGRHSESSHSVCFWCC